MADGPRVGRSKRKRGSPQAEEAAQCAAQQVAESLPADTSLAAHTPDMEGNALLIQALAIRLVRRSPLAAEGWFADWCEMQLRELARLSQRPLEIQACAIDLVRRSPLAAEKWFADWCGMQTRELERLRAIEKIENELLVAIENEMPA